MTNYLPIQHIEWFYHGWKIKVHLPICCDLISNPHTVWRKRYSLADTFQVNGVWTCNENGEWFRTKRDIKWCVLFVQQVFVMLMIAHTISDRCLLAQILHKTRTNGKPLSVCVKHSPHLLEPVIQTMKPSDQYNGNQSHSKRVIKLYLNINA